VQCEVASLLSLLSWCYMPMHCNSVLRVRTSSSTADVHTHTLQQCVCCLRVVNLAPQSDHFAGFDEAKLARAGKQCCYNKRSNILNHPAPLPLLAVP
jgi:hypothetical protein